MQINVEWCGGLRFEAKGSDAEKVVMDAPAAVGGEGKGFRPKQLLLAGLAGCTAMDVISILRKMRCEPASFRVEVVAGETEEHPKTLSSFHIIYHVSNDLPDEKLFKAIDLSLERYCGVTAMYRSFAPVTHEVVREG